jgi:hypothetical protein
MERQSTIITTVIIIVIILITILLGFLIKPVRPNNYFCWAPNITNICDDRHEPVCGHLDENRFNCTIDTCRINYENPCLACLNHPNITSYSLGECPKAR